MNKYHWKYRICPRVRVYTHLLGVAAEAGSIRIETRSYGRITAAAADFTAMGEVVIDNTILRTIICTYIPLLYIPI